MKRSRLVDGMLPLLVILILIASACNQNSEIKMHLYENKLGIKPARLAQIDTVHFTTIQWIEPVKNIGTMQEGGSVILQFEFKNTGVHPLFIVEAIPSCGCTLPEFPEAAIMPGDDGILIVQFKTAGQAGDVHKSIIVTSNTSNGAKHTLLFEGKVTAKKQT